MSDRRESRVVAARMQARRAKIALAAGGTAVFVLALPLARLQYGGHAKRPLRSLDAPQRFRRSVRKDLLSAGLLAPAKAPPEASTALS